MGEAKRRREELGDLYGTPQGSNRRDRLAQHVQHLATGADVENDAATDLFRKSIVYLLTPDDQFWVWSLLEEPKVDRHQTCPFPPAPGADPGIAAVNLCRDGLEVWLELVPSDPSRPAQRRDQEALDRENLERIRLHLADGDRVILFGTAEARPLAEAAGLPWVHELPEGKALPQAIAWDLEVTREEGCPPLPANWGFSESVLILGAGSGPWIEQMVKVFDGDWKPGTAMPPAQ
jgi:hypothetical protein